MTIPRTSNDPLASLTIVGLVLSVGIVLYTVVQLLLPPNILQLQTSPMPVRPAVLKAGQTITVVFDYCKRIEVQGVVGFFMSSRGLIVPMPNAYTALPVGCHRVEYLLTVPFYTPSGSYKIYMAREYQPTIFQQRHYLFESAPFVVEK